MKAPNLEMKERQMLELLTEGASTRVIAKKMGYSEGTVRVYLHNMYKKIGVGNRTEALLWQLEQRRAPAEPDAAPPPSRRPVSQADESFGDVALRDGLLGALGVMESFTGPFGRVWEFGVRLKGAPIDESTLAMRDEVRALWRALLQANFGHAKRMHEEGYAARWIESSPAEAALLASTLLVGGFTHAADATIAALARGRKDSRVISARDLTLLRSIRSALYSRDESGLDGVQHAAAERSAHTNTKHLAMAALFHIYRIRQDAGRARDAANALWLEAEAGRRQLEAMGVRPLSSSGGAQRPTRTALKAREKAAAGI
jgi:DNA-binding CsgD family transcriptional regulator